MPPDARGVEELSNGLLWRLATGDQLVGGGDHLEWSMVAHEALSTEGEHIYKPQTRKPVRRG